MPSAVDRPVLAGTAGARAVGFGIVTALDDQGPPVGARHDVFGPALHRLDCQRRSLGNVSVGINDPHASPH